MKARTGRFNHMESAPIPNVLEYNWSPRKIKGTERDGGCSCEDLNDVTVNSNPDNLTNSAEQLI